MLSKWLDAARKRLGGTFPRDAAQSRDGGVRREDAPAQSSRAASRPWLGWWRTKPPKLRGSRSALRLSQVRFAASFFHPVAAAPYAIAAAPYAVAAAPHLVTIPQASTAREAVAPRAQDSIQARFRERGKKLRDDCEECLGEMPEEDEWFYGADLVRREAGRGDAVNSRSRRSCRRACGASQADFQVFEQGEAVSVSRRLSLRALCFRDRISSGSRRAGTTAAARGRGDAVRTIARRLGARPRHRPSPSDDPAGDDR